MQRAIEQRTVRRREPVRQARVIDREAVVLAGDHHLAGGEILHRVVGAVMAEFHLHGTRTTGQRQQSYNFV